MSKVLYFTLMELDEVGVGVGVGTGILMLYAAWTFRYLHEAWQGKARCTFD